jgi:hypothetical protein
VPRFLLHPCPFPDLNLPDRHVVDLCLDDVCAQHPLLHPIKEAHIAEGQATVLVPAATTGAWGTHTHEMWTPMASPPLLSVGYQGLIPTPDCAVPRPPRQNTASTPYILTTHALHPSHPPTPPPPPPHPHTTTPCHPTHHFSMRSLTLSMSPMSTL